MNRIRLTLSPAAIALWRLAALLAIASVAACVESGETRADIAWCQATDNLPNSVQFSWAPDNVNLREYRIYRYPTGNLIALLSPSTTTFTDYPPPGTFQYIVEAHKGGGFWSTCNDYGTMLVSNPQPPPQSPQPCSATNDTPSETEFSWTRPGGSIGYYRIYVDGFPAGLIPGDITSFVHAAYGTHEYCVRAQSTQLGAPCCATGPRAETPPASPGACEVTESADSEEVTITWGNVDNEDAYNIYRNGELVGTVARDVTSFVDRPPCGVHEYCVTSRNFFGESAPCCETSVRCDVRLQLSWETCVPRVPQEMWRDPGPYHLVASAVGGDRALIGHDTAIEIGPDVPDAWRFDPAGCQTEARLAVETEQPVDECPPLTGSNPFVLFGFSYDASSSFAVLRLVVSFDAFSPVASQRYALWRVAFDHSYSNRENDADPQTCDDVQKNLELRIEGVGLREDGELLAFRSLGSEGSVTWGEDVPLGVQRSTIGRVKALYR